MKIEKIKKKLLNCSSFTIIENGDIEKYIVDNGFIIERNTQKSIDIDVFIDELQKKNKYIIITKKL